MALSTKTALEKKFDLESNDKPFHGVVACLTGMSAERKDQYHEWIQALGGVFTRDFHTSRNTHLIAKSPTGEKYETAMACQSLLIVKPSWLEACQEHKSRVPEDQYAWKSTSKRKKRRSTPQRPCLLQSLEQALRGEDQTPNSLFCRCQFFLVGFENHDKERAQLGRMLRRGMGTIFWEFEDSVTHVLVHDHCDDTLRDSISKAKLQLFGNYVTVVSPWWTVESWEKKQLLSPRDYPPQLEQQSRKTSKKSKKLKKDNPNTLFRGCIFVLLRTCHPPARFVDYDEKELETLITSHSGQILSSKLLETLKTEQQARPKCHVICFGGRNPKPQFALHPLLAQVQRTKVCEIIQVTPNWLQSCVSDQAVVDPAELPLLFQPPTYAWRKLVLTQSKDKQDEPMIRISLTGFQGSKRTAFQHAIQAMGAVHDASLHKGKTTHLIGCAEQQSNPKFQKAREWGIPVVTEDWLYHVLQKGFQNEEANFAVETAEEAS